MGLSQRRETADDCGLGILDALFAGKAPGNVGQHNREQVPGAMLNFACQHLLPSLGLLFIADVTGDLGGADDFPCWILHGRYRQRNVNEISVLALADGLVVVDALAPLEFALASPLPRCWRSAGISVVIGLPIISLAV